MPKSIRLGGILQGHGGLGTIPLLSIASPHAQSQRRGSQPWHQGRARPNAEDRKEEPSPRCPPLHMLLCANLLPQHLQASNPHVLFVCHAPFDPVKSSSSVASRQSTGLVCPSATETHCSGAVRVFLVPPTGLMLPLAWERKNKHGGACVEKDHATQFHGHGRTRDVSLQASPTTWQHYGLLHPNPAHLSKDLQANPVNLPRSSPCLLPLPQQHRWAGRGCPAASALLLNLSCLAGTDPRSQEIQLIGPQFGTNFPSPA